MGLTDDDTELEPNTEQREVPDVKGKEKPAKKEVKPESEKQNNQDQPLSKRGPKVCLLLPQPFYQIARFYGYSHGQHMHFFFFFFNIFRRFPSKNCVGLCGEGLVRQIFPSGKKLAKAGFKVSI